MTAAPTVREAGAKDMGAITAFVQRQAHATPFHLPTWGHAVARACGQRAHWLLAEHRDGTIAGVLPLTQMRSPLFGRALVSAGFAVDGGVLGAGAASLASAAIGLAIRLRLPTVELRGGAAVGGWTVDETTYVGFARDLAQDDAAQLATIPRKQRAEVRKALAADDLEVVTGRDRRSAEEHYGVYAESVRNLGTPVFPRALMREVLETMDADVLTVRHRGQAVASVLSLYHGGTVYPFWGGGTREARSLRANELMYFALMRHARALGCTRFDFGRSKAGTGAAAFKKNWGFVGEPLRYATWNAGAPRVVNPLDPRYARMVAAWRRLPLPVANTLGPWISRGLG